MAQAKEFRFPLPKACSIRSVHIRETDGKDEAQAAGWAEAAGNPSMIDELVRVAITRVNDAPAVQPLADYDGWSTRTRKLVFEAWRKINGIKSSEVDDFLKGAEEVVGASAKVAAPSVPSSAIDESVDASFSVGSE